MCQIIDKCTDAEEIVLRLSIIIICKMQTRYSDLFSQINIITPFCDHWHTQVRPRPIAVTAHWTALAQHARASRVQALHHGAQYLVDLCLPVSDVASRQHLRTASRQLLVLLHHWLQTYGRRTFYVAGPSAWNSLPDNLRDPSVTGNSLRRLLKTHLFSLKHLTHLKMHYTNLLLTYFLFLSLNRTHEHTSSWTWRSCIRLMVMLWKNCWRSRRCCTTRWRWVGLVLVTSRATTEMFHLLSTLHLRFSCFNTTSLLL